MVEHRRGLSRGWGGRYVGARVNCERIPCLPAAVVAWVLNDPRQVPKLLVWKDPRTDEVMEVVRVALCGASGPNGLRGLRGGKAHRWKPEFRSHRRVLNASEPRSGSASHLSPMPKTATRAVRLESESDALPYRFYCSLAMSRVRGVELRVGGRMAALSTPFAAWSSRGSDRWLHAAPASRAVVSVYVC